LVKEKTQNGFRVLHCAAANPQSLRILLHLYPCSQNQDSLQAIFLSLNDDEKLWKAYELIEKDYNTNKQKIIGHLKRFANEKTASSLVRGPGYRFKIKRSPCLFTLIVEFKDGSEFFGCIIIFNS